VAETDSSIYMLEPKVKKGMDSPEVTLKKDAAVKWCRNATNHTGTYGGKPWKYLLIPHDCITENMTLDILVKQFSCN